MDLMEIDDSIHMKRNLTTEGLVTKVDFQRRNPPSRCVSVGLGLLCAVLLAGNVGQFLYYHIFSHIKSADMMQASYNTGADQLQGTSNASAAERKLFEATLSNLTKEKDQLHTIYHELQRGKEELQTQFNTMKTKADELQRSYSSLNSDKDQLQKSYSNLTQSKNLLQNRYQSLSTDKEALQGRYNTLQREKEQLRSDYRNLATVNDQLQKSMGKVQGDLIKEKDRLQQSYNTLTQEKNQLQTNYNDIQTHKETLQVSYNTLQREKDQLQTNYRSLSAVKDQLEKKISKVKERPCQSRWTKFGDNCYYLTAEKRNWTSSRDYCNTEGADLVIINSRDEQVFVNGLLGSGEDTWIGLTDSVTEGTWRWVDGTLVTTTFWGVGQPNNYQERDQDCVEFWQSATGGSWNDEICSATNVCVCEK
nr:CD209 antigen-like [Labrus bergylta]